VRAVQCGNRGTIHATILLSPTRQVYILFVQKSRDKHLHPVTLQPLELTSPGKLRASILGTIVLIVNVEYIGNKSYTKRTLLPRQLMKRTDQVATNTPYTVQIKPQSSIVCSNQKGCLGIPPQLLLRRFVASGPCLHARKNAAIGG
jgi:hypothetical protein